MLTEFTVWEHPAIEIRGDGALVHDITSYRRIGRVLSCIRLDDLVIGKDIGRLLRGPNAARRTVELAPSAPITVRALMLIVSLPWTIVDADRPIPLVEVLKRFHLATQAFRTGAHGTLAQPGIEFLAVDHADISAVTDFHIDLAVGLGEIMRADVTWAFSSLTAVSEVLYGARRYGAAARLDPILTVDHQHAPPAAGEHRWRLWRPGRAAADDNDVITGIP